MKLTYFSQRKHCDITLDIQKTETGWFIKYIAHNGDTGPDGSPVLESSLNQDYGHYPVQIGSFLEHVWERLHNGDIDEAWAQQMLDDIGRWISACEAAAPKWPGYSA